MSKLLAVTCAILGMSASPVSAAPITLNQNAILNGAAESGVGSADGSVVSVPDWSPTGNFTAVQYGASAGFPSLTDPGPASRGSNFFAGGGGAFSSGSQVLDVSNISPEIDAGSIAYTLSGYLGGFSTQSDNAVLTASFLSPSSTLGSASIGPVTTAERGGLTGLLFRSTTGSIPTGTRTIDFTLALTRVDGSYDDGYADNLSFVATSSLVPPVPEPGTFALVSGSFCLAMLAIRRFRTPVR